MTTTSFLNEGAAIPAGSAVTDMTTETSLPPILTSSATAGINMANDQLNRDYVAPPMPTVAGATANQTNAFNNVGTAANAYVPGLNAATGATTDVMNAPGALSVAQPYLTNAGRSTVSGIDQYMNPYINAVIDRIGELGQRNLTDVLMPAVEGRYIGAGQLNFGGRGGMGTPSGMMTDTARAIRDTNADILGKQAEELRTGYNLATGLSAADLDRQLNLGRTTADIYGSDASRKLASANQLAALAADAQNLGLTGVNAMYNLGEKERGITNENYKAAYDEWMRQYNEPTERLKTFSDILNGLRTSLPTGQRQSGISPSGVQQQNKPGTLATIFGGLATVAGILDNDDESTIKAKIKAKFGIDI